LRTWRFSQIIKIRGERTIWMRDLLSSSVRPSSFRVNYTITGRKVLLCGVAAHSPGAGFLFSGKFIFGLDREERAYLY
jgi:hypothetical protein